MEYPFFVVLGGAMGLSYDIWEELDYQKSIPVRPHLFEYVKKFVKDASNMELKPLLRFDGNKDLRPHAKIEFNEEENWTEIVYNSNLGDSDKRLAIAKELAHAFIWSAYGTPQESYSNEFDMFDIESSVGQFLSHKLDITASMPSELIAFYTATEILLPHKLRSQSFFDSLTPEDIAKNYEVPIWLVERIFLEPSYISICEHARVTAGAHIGEGYDPLR